MRRVGVIFISFGLILFGASFAIAGHAGSCRTGQEVIHLTYNNDNESYGAQEQCVDALDGNDTVDLGNGDDDAQGGKDTDVLIGGGGSDHLQGQTGHDLLVGDAGGDILEGGGNDDDLYDGPNGPSGDLIIGGDGHDILFHCHDGNQENDTVFSIEDHDHNGDEYCQWG